MTRYVAFLRGINVGGHNVKKETFVELFEDLGFTGVSTFLASGNVIFETDDRADRALEARIDRQLHEGLGYEAPSFVRSAAELADIAARDPFPKLEVGPSHTVQVLFLTEEPTAAVRRSVEALEGDVDHFAFHGRELHWLVRGNLMDSKVGRPLEKALHGVTTTARNVNTVRRLAARLTSAT